MVILLAASLFARETYKQIRVLSTSTETITILQNSGLDIDHSYQQPGEWIEFVIPESKIPQLISTQLSYTIIRYYIQALDNTGKLATLPMAGYYSFQAIGGTVYADGDLNMDGTVNILDIVSMVNVVLNGEQNSMADLNNDGVVNILDIILLVNIILG